MIKLKTLLLTGVLFSTRICSGQNSPAIASYTNFIKGQHLSAKEYVLNLFKTHDIVIICERLHPEFTQYEFLLDVIKDTRFITEVGNVFTEVGVSSLNPSLNNFLHTRNLSKAQQQEKIIQFHRNLMWSVMWDPLSYSYLLENLYTINNGLAKNDAVNLYPSDIPFEWKNADSLYFITKVLSLIKNRDSVIASQVIRQFDIIQNSSSRHKKALVIMNYRHAFNNNFYMHDGRLITNVANLLFKRYGNKVANVLLNCNGWNREDHAILLQEGKWDAAFAASGNKNTGFDLKGSPFGKDSFDLWVPGTGGFTYQDVFTGFVFYNPVEAQKLVSGVPGFLDSAFLDEYFRRYRLSRFVPTNMRQLSDEEIAEFKKDPVEMEKQANTKRELPLPDIDSLLKMRNGWLK